jgi:protein-disulfide isomerase
MRGARPVQPALLFEDPLCPTCKAFHERLVGEGAVERLDARLALFPLDSECNWMLNEPLHPGACIVSKAILCGGDQARQVLEWAYDKQTELSRAGKSGPSALRGLIRQRWGESLLRCMDERKTEVRLNNHLHFASDNGIPVSTPQVYFGKKRICDEDTDIGLRYTLGQLAPEVLK